MDKASMIDVEPATPTQTSDMISNGYFHFRHPVEALFVTVIMTSLFGLLLIAVMVWFRPPSEWSIFNGVMEVLRVTLASALSSYFTQMQIRGK
jgi:hypothetical protein